MASFDLISNLPDHILSSILTFLPIKDAIRTCILSNMWRHLWTSIPNLEFKEEEDRVRGLVTDEKRRELVDIVDQGLESREMSIRRFRISLYPKRFCYHVDRWIFFLTKNGIEELDLEFTADHIWDNEWHGRYELPSCLFDCETLRVLKLRACTFKPPSSFQGFGFLETLVLGDISLSEDLIRCFLPKCRSLRSLTLQRCEGFEILDISDSTSQLDCLRLDYCHSYIEIYAPKIREFSFYGEWIGFSLKEAPCLANVIIFLKTNKHGSRPHVFECSGPKMKKILSDLVQLESLSLIGLSLKCWAAGRVISSFRNLKKLEVEVCLQKKHECFGTVKLLQCCPLEEFIIWIKYDVCCEIGILGYWDMLELLDCHIQRININDFSGLEFEMEFVWFLLLNMLDLTTLSINTKNDMDSDESLLLAQKLSRLKKVSLHGELLLNQVKIQP